MKSLRKALRQACVLFIAGMSACWAGDKITVMTRNMDAGTDFGPFIANFQTDPALGVQLTLEEVAKNDFPGRAALLAQEIATAKPDLVGLQEVTLWTLPTPDGIAVVDQLQLLLAALAAQDEPYTVVAVNTLTNLAFPVGASFARFTDRDAIIVRARSPVALGDPQAGRYQTLLPFAPGITVQRGWLSVDASVANARLRFVTTHLESAAELYGNPQVDLIQAAQAQELAQLFASALPLVIAGDFNSNATHTPPEQTAAYKIMLGYGYVDAWSAVHRGVPGFTWPLYLEDPLREHVQGPLERIDLVFARGIAPTSIIRTGLRAPHASDHAGVLATFEF
jgi:endonuclease/exonuclease/phosphatase family metal-dependent hydrolase